MWCCHIKRCCHCKPSTSIAWCLDSSLASSLHRRSPSRLQLQHGKNLDQPKLECGAGPLLAPEHQARVAALELLTLQGCSHVRRPWAVHGLCTGQNPDGSPRPGVGMIVSNSAMLQVSSLVPQHQAHACCTSRAWRRHIQGCSTGRGQGSRASRE